jgi:hypothetical protein
MAFALVSCFARIVVKVDLRASASCHLMRGTELVGTRREAKDTVMLAGQVSTPAGA